ncbi:uncharacterized protein N7503_005158 [Penicillium pulvis]|uniref:uncharacterized protein n=1 Tax=Penicillium pulvis TaxID=1562058 RepID=UPI0025468904|nr:uncharacterized protein N7503_005158 [Penicillium pulvis]KAJ5802708.1 hypothetical protein N7503_005158 [Penicillium pulvis]
MTVSISYNKTLKYALRALQLIFAITIIGIVGYAIHVFRGHTVYEHFVYGNFYDYYGVPDAWGFLLFCAALTVVIVIFYSITGIILADSVWIGYVRVALEAVAVLSWLAGFIAVAVQISNDTCATGNSSCGLLEAATVFGALEWLLFMVTAALTMRTTKLGGGGEHKTASTSH